MKKILSLFLALAVFAAIAHAAPPPTPAKPRNIVTKDGTTYHNATIISHNGSEAMVACDEGTVFIKLVDMPPDIQQELGFKGEGVAEREAAAAAAAREAAAEQAVKDKIRLEESRKHEYVVGTEKEKFPQLNPDFFPDELVSQISAYNTKAQFTSIIAGDKSPDSVKTVTENTAILKTLHANYLEYKNFVAKPPEGADLTTARKAVADGNYKPYVGEPEVVAKAIMGIPDKVDESEGKRVYHYGDSRLLFADGKYVGDPRRLPKPQQ
jgi:hypothetical protein